MMEENKRLREHLRQLKMNKQIEEEEKKKEEE